MWRDIDSLRKQNESTKREIESMRKKSKQTEIETEILRRQNKALALIESRGLDALLKEASIPGSNHSKHPEDHLDLELLEEKLLALGCDVDDVPFLFDVLELTKAKELSPLHPISEGLAQAKKIPTLDKALDDAFKERQLKFSGFDEYANGRQLPNSREQQHRSLAEHAYRNTSDRIVILRCLGPEDFSLERVVFPLESLCFACPKDSQVHIWIHGLGGQELLEIIRAEDLLAEDLPLPGKMTPLHPSHPRPYGVELFERMFTLGRGLATYYLQVLALAFGARQSARRLLERASQLGLAGLGVEVLMERRGELIDRPQIHIANHGNPLDMLLVQGYFREASMTTAARHLHWLLPFFAASARNYGHTNVDHLSARSRLAGLRHLLCVLDKQGRLFLFPSGSLITPITQRVSGSLHVLGRRSGAVIIPWTIRYRGFPPSEEASRYRPLRLIVQRLFGPQATILCEQGATIDPNEFADQNSLSLHIRELYADKLGSINLASHSPR
jgi:hypothetical protein